MPAPLLDSSSAPLHANEAAELLGSTVDETTAATLYEDSGGNPFYLEQLGRVVSRATSSRIGTSQSSLGDLDVPPLVAAALAEELDLLPDESRLLLRGAAVAGDPFDPELATAAAAVERYRRHSTPSTSCFAST